MANAMNAREMLLQNLKDAGCSEAAVNSCMELADQGNPSGMIPILKTCRTELLKKIHEGQKELDCLDYLLYQLRKTEKKKAQERK